RWRKTSHGTWKLESKGYGNATIDGGKVTADTLFAIGSNFKLFNILATGLLISNMTLTSRISWTSIMASILPGWKLMDPVATSESTILDLMSHRTGLPRHDLMAPLDSSVADYLRPSTGFREQLQYNNHMYTVLSYLPQVLLNTTYETYVRDNMFVPLGMNATAYFYADAVEIGGLAEGFVRENANFTEDPFHRGTTRVLPYWDRSEEAGSGEGGVISNSRDMAIWLQMLLTEGKSQSNETATVIQKVAAGLTVYKAVAAYPELSPVVYGGRRPNAQYLPWVRYHLTALPGFKSQITRFPGQNLGIAVLSNEEELGTLIAESVKYRIIDAALQLDPIDWPARYLRLTSYRDPGTETTRRYHTKLTETVPPPPVPRADNAAPPSVAYAALAGTYAHPAYGTLDLCLFADARPTSACAGFAAEVAQTPPGVLDPRMPTLLAH
ncbi:beta-lactamase/transpeptidase-like protein, partial [Mycena vulgaris]